MPGLYTFAKQERLCSLKLIKQVFDEGKKSYFFPFRLVYLLAERDAKTPARIVISVPKKLFKQAVTRNLLKRRIREAYRKSKPDFYSKLPPLYTVNILLIYVSPNIAPYAEIESKLAQAVGILAKRIEKDINLSVCTTN